MTVVICTRYTTSILNLLQTWKAHFKTASSTNWLLRGSAGEDRTASVPAVSNLCETKRSVFFQCEERL